MADTPGILAVYNMESLAALLRIQPKKLAYIIYKVKDEDRYSTFEIPKKRGGARTITAPEGRLKTIQRRLAAELLEAYPERHCVHGFAKGKSIRSNARAHLHKRWVINIDLKDFFPSIHFGRVVGVFKAEPFSFGDRLAREIANICCFNKALPQGAPTSPIISNFICWRLDNELFKYAKSCKCIYTRYADDIAFSGDEIPVAFIKYVKDIISDCGFEVNEKKVRLYGKKGNKILTGISLASGKPRVPRDYRRNLEKELYYVKKYGIDAHMNHMKIRRYNYLESLIGRVDFWQMVEPDNKLAASMSEYLQEEYRLRLG